tara:strand:+ start:592 stop:1128 length:537 start_codon:yes stop_codon:yes gene_type:complete
MIETYDDFLSSSSCQRLYSALMNSVFRIGWGDSDELHHRQYPNLYAEYSTEELRKLKILDPVLNILIKDSITMDNYFRCRINLTKPLDLNFIHVHPDQIVALYYCNLTWSPEHGGETIFYTDDKKHIKLATPYTANRLIIFDGSIPHTIKAQNLLGQTYRFTLSLFFWKNNIGDTNDK